jgi:hypothetical protein
MNLTPGNKKRLRNEARRAHPQHPGEQLNGGWNKPLCDPNNDNLETRQQKRCRLLGQAAADVHREFGITGKRNYLFVGYHEGLPRRVRRAIIRARATAAFQGGRQ